MNKILVVDDDPTARALLRMTLEGDGYHVEEAADGAEAVKRYHNDPPDLVIMDLFMPEQEGLETIVELCDASPGVKIIAISGGGRFLPDNYLTVAERVGARATFTKPIVPRELLAAVRVTIDAS